MKNKKTNFRILVAVANESCIFGNENLDSYFRYYFEQSGTMSIINNIY